MAKLYELTSNLAQLLTAIEEGEIPEEAVADTLEAVEGEFDAKCDDLVSFIKNMTVEAEAIKAEADKLVERYKAKINRIESMKSYLREQLFKVGKVKHESARHLVTFRRSAVLNVDTDNYLEWARINAPETIKRTVTEKPIAESIRELMKHGDVPHVSEEIRYNIQIK